MTEEEEFRLLEEKLRREGNLKLVPDYMHDAVLAAQRFIEDSASELGVFTLRKAFELGYRQGRIEAARKAQSAKVCGND
jgi:hypothetical protein